MKTLPYPRTVLVSVLGIIAMAVIASCGATQSANPESQAPPRSIAEIYVEENLLAFVANPSSQALHRVGCGMFNALHSQPAIQPESLLVRYVHQPDEYRATVKLLIDHSVWFTDYCTASPSFQWRERTFTSTPELLASNLWKMTTGTRTTIITWDALVTTLMQAHGHSPSMMAATNSAARNTPKQCREYGPTT